MAQCNSPKRREFLLKSMTMAAALPVVAAVQTFSQSARAQAFKMVDPKDPMAAAIGYVKNVDKAKSKDHKAGQYCWNCLIYMNPQPAGKPKNESTSGACGALAGKGVNWNDWCKSSYTEDATMKGKKHI